MGGGVHPDVLLKFNIAPEKLPSQKGKDCLPTIFQGRAINLEGCINLQYSEPSNANRTLV